MSSSRPELRHIEFCVTPTGVQASVLALRSNLFIALLSLWLVGWAAAEAWGLKKLFTLEGQEQTEILVTLLTWFVGWTVAGLMAIKAIAWQLKGREIISIANDKLTHRVEAFGIGKKREYQVGQLRAFGAAQYRHDDEYVTWAIAFSYASRTVYFAKGLTQEESKDLAGRLSAHLPPHCSET